VLAPQLKVRVFALESCGSGPETSSQLRRRVSPLKVCFDFGEFFLRRLRFVHEAFTPNPFVFVILPLEVSDRALRVKTIKRAVQSGSQALVDAIRFV
jgi:hypothetical protein